MNCAAQFATESRLLASFFSQLIASHQVGQFGGDLSTMVCEPLLFGRCQGTGNST